MKKKRIEGINNVLGLHTICLNILACTLVIQGPVHETSVHPGFPTYKLGTQGAKKYLGDLHRGPHNVYRRN